MQGRIEICGGIAAGKTTLCNLLCAADCIGLFEDFRHNPFWSSFYQNPQLHGFETETTFLLQHYSSVKSADQSCRSVCDFSLFQDLAYARLNLGGGQYEAFRAVYDQILREVGKPLLLIHLRCSAKMELTRIRRRGRDEESGILVEYLDRMNESIYVTIQESALGVPVLEIDSETDDFASDSIIQDRIVTYVRSNVLSSSSRHSQLGA